MRRPFFLFVGRVTQLRRRQQNLRILANSASSSSSNSREDAMYSSKALCRATSSASRSAMVAGKADGMVQSSSFVLLPTNYLRHKRLLVVCVCCASRFPNFRYSSWVSPQGSFVGVPNRRLQAGCRSHCTAVCGGLEEQRGTRCRCAVEFWKIVVVAHQQVHWLGVCWARVFGIFSICPCVHFVPIRIHFNK